MATTFIVVYTYADKPELRREKRDEHRAYLSEFENGPLLAGGALGPDEEPGGVLVIRASDRSEVQAIVDGDPFYQAGVVADARILAWLPSIGAASGALGGTR